MPRIGLHAMLNTRRQQAFLAMRFHLVLVIIQETKSAKLLNPAQHFLFCLLKIIDRKQAVGWSCMIQSGEYVRELKGGPEDTPVISQSYQRASIVVFIIVIETILIIEQIFEFIIQLQVIIIIRTFLPRFFHF